MATIQLNLPDDVREHLITRAAETGCKTVDEYVEALVLAELEEDESDDE